MFQDDVQPENQRLALHEAYGRMADAVGASLRNYLWVVRHMHHFYRDSAQDIHVVPALLLIEFADPIDGVSLLAWAGSARNCAQLLRTGLELQLGMIYMMERDDTYQQRCLAYEFFHHQRQLHFAEQCDPNTQRGKQLRGQLKDDLMADLFDAQGWDVKGRIASEQAKVNSPRYAAVKAEYDRKKPNKWYGLWDGPKNAEALARHLKRHSEYEALYRYWSAVGHGEGAIKRIGVESKSDQLTMTPVRSPQGLPGACRMACALANGMTMFLIDRYLPHLRDENRERYLQNIKPGLAYIDSVRGLEG